ncbi:MAG: hypothetical protein ACK4R9_14200 [Ignavibacterium sp.]
MDKIIIDIVVVSIVISKNLEGLILIPLALVKKLHHLYYSQIDSDDSS